MRASLCRRLRDDGGISLVEMLIAIVLLTVGLLALLGTLIASAESLNNQRWTAAANRVASGQFELLRALAYDDPALDPGTGTQTVTLDGRTYTVARTVTEIAADPSGTLTADTVKRIDLAVSWTEKTTARSMDFSTAIAPPASTPTFTPSGTIGDIVADPATIWVDPSTGENTQTLTLTVPLVGIPPGTIVTLEYTDDNGSGLRTATYVSGSGVTFTFAAGDLTMLIPASESQATLHFTAFAQAASKGVSVLVQREPSTPLSLYGASISPSVIWIEQPGNNKTCDDNNQCRNAAAVTMTVHVDGFDTTTNVDSVRVRYPLHGGNYEEVSLVRVAVIDATNSRWSVTLPQKSVKFDAPSSPGAVASRTFTFIAIRTGDTPPTEVYLPVSQQVGRQA